MNIFDDEILRNYSCNNSQANHLPYSTVLYVGVPYILLFIYFRNTQLSRRSHEGEKRESKTVLLTSHGNKERSLLTADPMPGPVRLVHRRTEFPFAPVNKCQKMRLE